MATRREARERALGLCYEAEQRLVPAERLLAEQPVAPDPYASEVLAGVDDHREEIDAVLRKFSEHWALERMPAVDRAVLRIACYELMYRPDVPTAVVITEAVELAKQYSTKDSGRFVNGMLGRIADHVRDDDTPASEDTPAP
ncbi:MAG TPA: transcription antitermination factor NusB [Acidimicrobiia bacterium]|jgi:N utilization substance protein B|nr:transcription antitermination factor NusB [Acidimicrobiia bacterium]